MESSGLLTNSEAAEYLGLGASTLEQWRHQGRGPVYLRIGNKVRYRREDLEQWLASRRVEPKRG